MHTNSQRQEAEALISRIFLHDRTCLISVREDKAFHENGWLALGTIATDPEPRLPVDYVGPRRGAFEWRVPTLESTIEELASLLTSTTAINVAPS